MVAKREENMHTRQRSMPEPHRSDSPAPDPAAFDTLDEMVGEAERELSYAAASQELLVSEVQKVVADVQTVCHHNSRLCSVH